MDFFNYFMSIFSPITSILVLLFLIVIIAKATKRPRTAKEIGDSGESQVATMLRDLQQRIGGYVINDITFPYKDSHSQIDHLFICKKGIFVIETKNYSGRVYGDEKQKYWTQVLAYGEEKHKMLNPLLQNNRHVRAVSLILHHSFNPISVVIFVKGNTRYIKSSNVFSVSEAKSFMLNHGDCYDEQTVSSIYNRLSKYKRERSQTASSFR